MNAQPGIAPQDPTDATDVPAPVRPNSAPKESDELLGAKLDFLDAVADWFVRLAERSLALGDADEALRYSHVAASVLVRQNRRLSDPRLERLLQAVGQTLGLAQVAHDSPGRAYHGKALWMHVLEETLPAGGLTAMATRWIENDGRTRAHGVVLMAQRAPIPDRLRHAVERSGGAVWIPPAGASAIDRARWLRGLTASGVEAVVLHAGVADTATLAAFAHAGGPPVLLVNHAAHIFWVGSSVVDRVLNCRGSLLEQQWVEHHRAARSAVLPIPLQEPRDAGPGGPDETALRTYFGLHADGPVILTIGATFKYSRTPDHDFLGTIENVLRRVPTASLLAVGVVPDPHWQEASARTGGRIVAIGPVDRDVVHLAQSIADVYAEGFPFGTTTSALESGLRGMPVVLAPGTCPPPYGTDGIAIDALVPRPADGVGYAARLAELIENPIQARHAGEALAASIRTHHVGDGWLAHLSALIADLPSEHRIADPGEPRPTPTEMHRHWVRFVERTDSALLESLEHAIVRALLNGLCPTPDRELEAACRRSASLRRGHGIPAGLLRVVLDHLLPRLSASAATKVFRGLSFTFRRRSWRDLPKRLRHPGRSAVRGSWYDSYRRVGR